MEGQIDQAAAMRNIHIILQVVANIVIGAALGFVGHALHADRPSVSLNNSSSLSIPGRSAQNGSTKVPLSIEEVFSKLISAPGPMELSRLLADLRAEELPGLMERAQKLPPKFRKELIPAIFERWLELDRSAAVAWIREKMRDASCYEAWAKAAPDEALEFIFRSSSLNRFRGAIVAGLETLAGKDARARIGILMRYPSSQGRDQILLQEFQRWTETDPGTAYSWAVNIPEGKLRNSMERSALKGLASVDPSTASKRVSEMIPKLKPSLYGSGFISEFVGVLAAKDRTLAMRFAEALPDEFRKFPIIAIGANWAKTEPLAALAWSYEQGVDISAHYLTETMGSGSIVEAAFATQPKETIDWLLSLPDTNERGIWLQALLHNNFLKGDGELGMKIFEGLSANRQFRLAPDLGRVIASGGNFPDLATWTSSFPDEAVRARALAGAVGQFFEKIPARVDSIMSGLPEGPIRDQALLELVRRQSWGTPADAASRALEIHDESVRFDALDQAMRRWLDRDRERAVDWLQTHDNIPRAWISEWLPNELNRSSGSP
jgi:hypothetical protein